MKNIAGKLLQYLLLKDFYRKLNLDLSCLFSTRAVTLRLFPSVTCPTKVDLDLSSIFAECKDDLPNCETADKEI